MKHRSAFVVLCIVSFFVGFVALPCEGGDAEVDKKLISSVKAASEKGIEPEKVEEAVGSKATLNTIHKDDQLLSQRVGIAPDPDRKPELPKRDSLRHFAYWVRPVDGQGNPKLVGVCWPRDGKPQVFFGEVLPP